MLVEVWGQEPESPGSCPLLFARPGRRVTNRKLGEVVSINHFSRLLKGIVTPVELDGLRLLVSPLPQEEFNATGSVSDWRT